MRGTVGNRILERSIVKHISGEDGFRPGPGLDYSVLEKYTDDKGMERLRVAAQGHSSQGRIAIIRAGNNLAMAGARIREIMITMTAGEDCPERNIRKEMLSVTEYAAENDIRIIGGDTVFCGEGSSLNINVTAFSEVSEEINIKLRRKPGAGDLVVVSGYTGLYGASLIFSKNEEDLGKRFPKSYIKKEAYNTGFTEKDLDVTYGAEAMIRGGAAFLHDVTFGGIYRTFYELSLAANLGVLINHDSLPIRQSTIEVCDFYNINPYLLLGTGALVAIVKKEELKVFEEEMKRASVDFAVAGTLTKEAKREIYSEKFDIRRSLNMYEEDEIFKLFKEI